VDALIKEARNRIPNWGHRIRTIFFGGGTPTLLPVQELEILLAAIQKCVDPHRIEEFTVEANPATVDCEKASLLKKYGVTRVSMGAQSFHPAELAALERLHSPADIEPSVRALRNAGIGQINLDLIFGIPGQTLESWTDSLERAVSLGIDHIACYGLTYEHGTPLTAQRDRGRVVACDENLEAQMYVAILDRLESAGFGQYEISNFAKPGCECRHNLGYWRNQPYVAIGPSAVGCYARRRYRNVPDLGRYVGMIAESGYAVVEEEVLTDEKVMTEVFMLRLRLNEGLPLTELSCWMAMNQGSDFERIVSKLDEVGLLQVRDRRIALTRQGLLLADHVISELVAALDLESTHAAVAP